MTGHPMKLKNHWGSVPNELTMSDSYATFFELRDLGIAAHSWI